MIPATTKNARMTKVSKSPIVGIEKPNATGSTITSLSAGAAKTETYEVTYVAAVRTRALIFFIANLIVTNNKSRVKPY